MALSFFSQYQGQRGEGAPGPELLRAGEALGLLEEGPADAAEPEPEEQQEVVLNAEVPAEDWAPLDLQLPAGFRAREWEGRPRRFIDGKDVGLVVAALRAPGGYPVPVRLSQIGAVVLCEEDGALRRRGEVLQRTVTFLTHPFPWHEVEALGRALSGHGLRLCHARPPATEDPARRLEACFDYALLRRIALNTSNNEMKQLEEGLAARYYQEDDRLTVIDGRLEPRFGQRNQRSPVLGVIKSHQGRYLHPLGASVRYALRPQQRTPVFYLTGPAFPVASCYLRLSGGLPDQGVVRVELPRERYEALPKAERRRYLDQLCATLYQYRCRQDDYGRAAVSLQPIVRAEESLGSLLWPVGRLVSQFYRLSGL